LEQLAVAEEEMRVQVEALTEMRVGLEAQHHVWRARFDGLPDAFIETDQDDTIVEVNRAAEDLLGKPRRTIVGKPVTALFPDTDRRGLRDVIAQLRRGGRRAHWSGTLLAASKGRPEVEIAVAATSAVGAVESAADARTSGSRFFGARWLLRPTRGNSAKLS
jgi:PAS domain S-box-containing protein